MNDHFDPQQLPDLAADSVTRDLGEQASLEAHLAECDARLAELPSSAQAEHAELNFDRGRTLQLLGRGADAWPLLFAGLQAALAAHDWGRGADACDSLSQCDQPLSLSALGQGIWLAVTFPVDPEISVHLLSHVVDETPDHSDGAAVAAATAHFIADLRAQPGPDRDRLLFFSQQLLGRVARRHSGVDSTAAFQAWIARLELDDPDKFLIRLRNVIDVLAQDDWWFDRDALRALIPE